MPKAISLSAIHSVVGYAPHTAQVAIHRALAQHRFVVVCAGRRTGKSTLGGHHLTPQAFLAKVREAELDPTGTRMEYWIVGPEYSDAEKEFRVLWNDLEKLQVPFDHPGSYYDANGGNMHISLWGGRFLVHAKSAKYPATLVGEGLDGIILAEAAKLKPSVWHKYLRPTLADKRGWCLMTSTPEGKNWFYEEWQRGADETQPNWWSIRMPSWSNDILFPAGRDDDEILDMSRGMSDEKFKQEIGAEFTEFVGRVFKNFDEEYHVGDVKFDPKLPVYLATDYGFTNPNVMLFIQVDNFDNVRVIAEYYERGRTDEEFVSDIKADRRLSFLAERATRLYPDPEDPKASTALANKLRVQKMSGTGGYLNARLDLIRRHLKVDFQHVEEGKPYRLPKFMVDRSCKHLVREMLDYRYPEDKTESSKRETSNPHENPLKKDDHAPEALGRFFVGYFSPREETSRARVRKARARA